MVKHALADLSTGFLVLGLIMGGFVTGVLGQNLSTLVILASALFLFAGLIRAAKDTLNPWISGFMVNLGSSLPVCIMAVTGTAFTSRPHFIAFQSSSLLAAIVGAHVRHFWRTAHPRAGLGAVGAFTVAVVLAAYVLVPTMLERRSTKHVEHVAPAFSFIAADGGRVTNASLHGRVAVLTFWATWCAPCREELPRINSLYQRYSKSRNIDFWAVNTEREDDLELSARKAKAYFEKTKLSFPLAISDEQTSKNLGVHSLPTLLIVDQRGSIRFVHSGYDGAERLEQMVERQITDLLRSGQED